MLVTSIRLEFVLRTDGDGDLSRLSWQLRPRLSQPRWLQSLLPPSIRWQEASLFSGPRLSAMLNQYP